MLLLGDVYLAGRFGWRGGLVIAASLAAAVVGFLAWRASARGEGPKRRREDSLAKLVLPLLAAVGAGLVVYLLGATEPVAPALVVAAPLGRRPDRVSETRDALPTGIWSANT